MQSQLHNGFIDNATARSTLSPAVAAQPLGSGRGDCLKFRRQQMHPQQLHGLSSLIDSAKPIQRKTRFPAHRPRYSSTFACLERLGLPIDYGLGTTFVLRLKSDDVGRATRGKYELRSRRVPNQDGSQAFKQQSFAAPDLICLATHFQTSFPPPPGCTDSNPPPCSLFFAHRFGRLRLDQSGQCTA